MQEKVLSYIKSHYLGLLTTVLVLLSLFLGYSWGMSNYRSNVNNGGIFIEKVLDSKNVSDAPTGDSYSNTETAKNGSSVPKTTSNGNADSVIIDSEKIRPIPKDTKPEDRPLYFFY